MLTLAFFFALMVQLTKGVDLLLRPHQQLWVRNTTDAITLWLHYRDPLSWYSERVSKRVVAAVDLVILLLWSRHLAFVSRPKLEGTLEGSALPFSGPARLVLLIVVVVAGVVAMRALFNQRIRRWLYASHSFRSFIVRYAILVGSYIALVLSVLFLLARPMWRLYVGGHVPFDVALLILLPFGCLGALVQVQVITGFVVLILRLLIFLAKFLVVALEAFMWRVVEYNKGPWAALTLAATIVITVAECLWKGAPH